MDNNDKPGESRMFQRPLSSAMVLLAGFAAALPVLAMGFGRLPTSIPFGQPLDLSVPLRLDGAAVPSPGCLQAQVHIGDHRLPPGSLLLQLEGRDAARVRIRSAAVVQEPTVMVQLTVGCSGPVSRKFVVLADPVQPMALAEAGPAAVSPAPALERPRARTPERTATRTLPRPAQAEPAVPAMPVATVDGAALAAAQQAASAAQTAAAAAEQRLRVVTADLDRLRGEAQAQRTLVAQRDARSDRVDDPGSLRPALIAFVVSLGLVALWLGWRVHGLRRERLAAWSPDGPEAVAADAAVAEAAGRPAAAPAGIAPNPAASADELIDLEQEVELFVLLGDKHAAVDLLDAHLRGSAGASPLPYLQLLELHRRLRDREAYAQVARRFGRRFDVDMPAWGGGAVAGRGLQDCPAMLAELQAHWAAPGHAVAWLEQRLFASPGDEMPGLAAYKDLLTLYAMARDLYRHVGHADDAVDLLLPLAGSEDHAAGQRSSIFDALEPGRARVVAVDVDLSRPAARPH